MSGNPFRRQASHEQRPAASPQRGEARLHDEFIQSPVPGMITLSESLYPVLNKTQTPHASPPSSSASAFKPLHLSRQTQSPRKTSTRSKADTPSLKKQRLPRLPKQSRISCLGRLKGMSTASSIARLWRTTSSQARRSPRIQGGTRRRTLQGSK